MTHRQDIIDLEDFLDGKLSPAEKTRIKELLDSSPDLRAELSVSQQLRRVLKQLPVKTPSDNYFDEVTDIILARTLDADVNIPEPAILPIRPSNRSNLFIFLQVAASLILFFTALTLGQSTRNLSQIVMPVSEYQILAKPTGLESTRPEWELTDAELSEMEIGITAVSSPGIASGLYTMTNVHPMRSR